MIKMKIVELNEMELMTIDGGAKKKSCKREWTVVLKRVGHMQVFNFYLVQTMENILQLAAVRQGKKTITSRKPHNK